MLALIATFLPSPLSRWLVGAGLMLLVILSIFLAGIHVESEHRDALDAKREVQEQKNIVDVVKRRLASEKKLSDHAELQRKKDSDEKAAIASQRDDALVRLRARPTRPAANGNVPGTAAAGPANGCTGRELYRDDAELLVRQAALADVFRIERDSCRARFEAARTETLNFNKQLEKNR